MKTFVIGDVHGHTPVLCALLVKAGLMDMNGQPTELARRTEIVQLGDLGNFGSAFTDDIGCMLIAERFNMKLLWGNHDMAVVSERHTFRGYAHPDMETMRVFRRLRRYVALSRHDYLLTHAGLHADYAVAYDSHNFGGSVSDFYADYLADVFDRNGQHPAIHGIGHARGGIETAGGILWRDDKEELLDIPQIFGHTRGLVRWYGPKQLCIDVAGKTDMNLVGVWLPDMQIVAVGEDADTNTVLFNNLREGVE